MMDLVTPSPTLEIRPFNSAIGRVCNAIHEGDPPDPVLVEQVHSGDWL